MRYLVYEIFLDLASIENLLKKHQLLEADINAHSDRINEMNAKADELLDSEQFDADHVDNRRKMVNERYQNVKEVGKDRREKLNKVISSITK